MYRNVLTVSCRSLVHYGGWSVDGADVGHEYRGWPGLVQAGGWVGPTTGRGRGCRPPPGQVISRPRAGVGDAASQPLLAPAAPTHSRHPHSPTELELGPGYVPLLRHQRGEQQLCHCMITGHCHYHCITADGDCLLPVSGAGSHCSQTGDHGRCVSSLPTTQPNLAWSST